MKVSRTRIPDVVVLEPRAFTDPRGFFIETWNRERYAEWGVDVEFVQDNLSYSHRGVLRGLHFQNPTPQGKLVSVVQGAVFDVAVDLRRGSPTFAEWVGAELSSENHRQMYVPPGFAHGFMVTGDSALFTYKCTAPYAPVHERSLLWNDPELGIEWPAAEVMVSPKDAEAPRLRDLPEPFLFTVESMLP